MSPTSETGEVDPTAYLLGGEVGVGIRVNPGGGVAIDLLRDLGCCNSSSGRQCRVALLT